MGNLVKMGYSDIIPKKHKFESELKKIQAYVNSASLEHEISKFQESGSFLKFTNHNVTGEEMNRCVEKINKNFIKQNESIVEALEMLKVIYNTFNTLDQDYIAGITMSLNGVKKAIEEAVYAQKCIEKSQLNIKTSQKNIQKTNKQIGETNQDIQKTIEILKATVNSLLENKRKVVELEEKLLDWDLLRNDVIRIKQSVNPEEIEKLRALTQTYIERNEEILNELNITREGLDALALVESQHKANIDQQLANQRANTDRIEKEMLSNVETINKNAEIFNNLALAKLSDREAFILKIISQSKEQYNIDKTQANTKFRWLFGIAGSSLLLNIVLILFKCLGI